jgi:hypothetical protein
MSQPEEQPLAGPDDETEIVVPQQDEIRAWITDDALVIERRSLAAGPTSPWGSQEMIVIQRPYVASFIGRLQDLASELSDG